jgi:hypothetical protein
MTYTYPFSRSYRAGPGFPPTGTEVPVMDSGRGISGRVVPDAPPSRAMRPWSVEAAKPTWAEETAPGNARETDDGTLALGVEVASCEPERSDAVDALAAADDAATRMPSNMARRGRHRFVMKPDAAPSSPGRPIRLPTKYSDSRHSGHAKDPNRDRPGAVTPSARKARSSSRSVRGPEPRV